MEPNTQLVSEGVDAEPGPSSFVAYTRFADGEEWLEQHLGERGPVKMPASWPNNVVRFLPWAILLTMPLHVAAVLALVGVSILGTLFGEVSILPSLLSVAILVLDVLALPGLFARSRRGWELLVYGFGLALVHAALSLSLFGVAGQAFGLWLAFQTKYRYG